MTDRPAAANAPAMGAHPERQVEVQLGHLCNNRCVFCVSGQLSEQDRAPQLPVEPILRQIREARQNGAARITLLGGEPTIQRSFAQILKAAVELDFDEVVIFTNGVMTPREGFRQRTQELLAGLGPDHKKRTVWRFSLQGGDHASHDATTINPGSFQRILDSLAILHGQGARLSGNMCAVESNYRSVVHLAAIAEQFQLENLHIDVMRPRDAGERSEHELRAMLPRYADMAKAFLALSREVDRRLGPGWDLNFGNLPYCTGLPISHRIHHDGGDTVTVAADGQGNTQEGFDKYADKRSDKHFLPSCSQCVFQSRCSGVFDTYREFFGNAEFQPVDAERLWQHDTAGHHFALLAEKPLRDAGLQVEGVDERAGQLSVRQGPWLWRLQRAGRTPLANAVGTLSAERWQAAVLRAPLPDPAALQGALELAGTIATALGGAGPTPAAWQRFQATWQQQARQQNQSARQAQQVVAGVAARLRGRRLGDLDFATADLQPDLALLRWGEPDAQLTVKVSARRDEQGRLRPHFEHEAVGLSGDRVAALSRALGQELRAAAR
ncbi:MAG: radical SAM protein [Deltaproteobacteria bacterium]|nr:radical SAM protein [Deltaproteobacteria bacterium]